MDPSQTPVVRMEICWITKSTVGMKYHELKFRERIKLNKIIPNMANSATLENAHFVM